MHMLSTMGRVKTKNIGTHAASAHKLARHPAHVHCFYSSGEDGVVRHYDIRKKRAGSEALMTVYSVVPSRVRAPPLEDPRSACMCMYFCMSVWSRHTAAPAALRARCSDG